MKGKFAYQKILENWLFKNVIWYPICVCTTGMDQCFSKFLVSIPIHIFKLVSEDSTELLFMWDVSVFCICNFKCTYLFNNTLHVNK